jgi:hypothetical protein
MKVVIILMMLVSCNVLADVSYNMKDSFELHLMKKEINDQNSEIEMMKMEIEDMNNE